MYYLPSTNRELRWPAVHIVGRPDTSGTIGEAKAREVQSWDRSNVSSACVVRFGARGQIDLSPCQFDSYGRGRILYLFLERHLAYKVPCLRVGVFPVAGSRPLGYAIVSFEHMAAMEPPLLTGRVYGRRLSIEVGVRGDELSRSWLG